MVQGIIELRDIVKRYDNARAILDGVSFSIGERECMMIYGKSGCGKTTLLNIIGGLDRPTSGNVIIDGQNIISMSENELAHMRLQKVGFVFQDFNLLQDLTIRENVALPLMFSKREDGRHVDQLLEKFDIAYIASETANKVSGGEAQRAAIARAMMNEPKIILADEPTGNLDDENTKNVMMMFRLVREEFGATIVLATHDQELACHATTKVLLSDGKVTLE